jgi:hypothetical protein
VNELRWRVNVSGDVAAEWAADGCQYCWVARRAGRAYLEFEWGGR